MTRCTVDDLSLLVGYNSQPQNIVDKPVSKLHAAANKFQKYQWVRDSKTFTNTDNDFNGPN